MSNENLIDIGLHGVVVILYAFAAGMNAWGIVRARQRIERAGHLSVLAGFLVHAGALIYRWIYSGHGPYMVRYEVLSSYAWITLCLYLIVSKRYPRLQAASILLFPSVLFLTAVALCFSPESRNLPPSLQSAWLLIHVTVYTVALGTIIIALVLSLLYILKNRFAFPWLDRFPEKAALDAQAYRFAGLGFLFWAGGVFSGSIWAHQSWGRFWGWDPVETWSLVTWLSFGVYLHLRRFFGWKGERSSYLFVLCFVLSLAALFFVPLLESSIHSEYFR